LNLGENLVNCDKVFSLGADTQNWRGDMQGFRLWQTIGCGCDRVHCDYF